MVDQLTTADALEQYLRLREEYSQAEVMYRSSRATFLSRKAALTAFEAKYGQVMKLFPEELAHGLDTRNGAS